MPISAEICKQNMHMYSNKTICINMQIICTNVQNQICTNIHYQNLHECAFHLQTYALYA